MSSRVLAVGQAVGISVLVGLIPAVALDVKYDEEKAQGICNENRKPISYLAELTTDLDDQGRATARLYGSPAKITVFAPACFDPELEGSTVVVFYSQRLEQWRVLDVMPWPEPEKTNR